MKSDEAGLPHEVLGLPTFGPEMDGFPCFKVCTRESRGLRTLKPLLHASRRKMLLPTSSHSNKLEQEIEDRNERSMTVPLIEAPPMQLLDPPMDKPC